MENNRRVAIQLKNGLGDKMLDLIGFYIICKYLHYIPCVRFHNAQQYAWGHNTYDLRLFRDFQDVVILSHNETCPFYADSPDPTSSVCPYRVFHFLRQFLPTITFEQISADFARYAKTLIQPSEIILQNIPDGIENAYGIHLRKSDKLTEYGNVRHENTTPEFETIIAKLLEDVERIILSDPAPIPTFLLVSEDTVWKEEIRAKIMSIAENHNKTVRFLVPNYTAEHDYQNYRSVLDMFCLSKCKDILQGVKFSTFSILAALLGNNTLRNYSKYTKHDHLCLIYIWNSVLEIHGAKNCDLSSHAQMTAHVKWLDTNICG